MIICSQMGYRYVGGAAYSAYEYPFDRKGLLNTNLVTLNNQYGRPYLYQLSRNIGLGLRFTL